MVNLMQRIYKLFHDGLPGYIVPALLATIILLASGGYARAQTVEYQVKAAFLYKFAAYVQWPAAMFSDADSPLVFGVLDADELADSLEQIVRDRNVNGHPIQVRRLQPGEPVQDMHVLFVGESATASIESSLSDMAAGSVLTVTETASRPSGSVINFEIIDNKVRFDVSLDSADLGGLQISSRLLQVAHKVINGRI